LCSHTTRKKKRNKEWDFVKFVEIFTKITHLVCYCIKKEEEKIFEIWK
jgi:hypothetical protein